MIVCHCNLITRSDIEEVVRTLLAEDPSARLEPQFVYARLEKRGKCCGCFPNAERVVREMLDAAMKEVDGERLSHVSRRPHLMPKEGS